MATAEEDMEVDGVSSTVPGPVYSWIDYALSVPKVFDCHFVYENIGFKHQWKITEVQYKLIGHFCSQEERQLELRSTFIYTDSIQVMCYVLSEEVRCIVNDIEKKLSILQYAEINQAVTDELRCSFDFKRLTTTECLVWDPISLPGRGILIFSPSYDCLCKAYKAVCSEFERKKERDTGKNFNITRKSYDQHTSGSLVYRSNPSSTSSSSTSPSVTNNQENDGVQIGSVKVKVNIGSILDAKVEAIVNATNKSLTFDAGVSKVICKAAGPVYEMDCKNLLRGPYLQTSKCYQGDPGRLRKKFNYILHAVGPHWSDYEKKEDCMYLLADTVTNVLKMADSLFLASVAMPAISSGNSSVPIKLCALAYIMGIQQFGTGRTLREVHFVDTDPLVEDEMKTACSKCKENPIPITPETMKSLYPEYFEIKYEDPRNGKSTSNGNAQVDITKQAVLSIQPLQFKKGRILVNVYQGSILKVKADAVVNAANEGLSHGAGVALAIRDAAGEEFDEECQRELRLKGSLKTTKVLATRPGNLKKQFKYILNAVGPRWDQYSDKTLCLSDLHDTIVNILKEAERLCVRTLVMPAISSKIFGVPLKLCAEMYLKGIIDFSCQTGLFLEEIHIVDIDISVLREMTDAYHKYKKKPDSISISGAKTRHSALMKTLTTSSIIDVDNEKSGQQTTKVDITKQAVLSIQPLQFQEGSILVNVYQGSILMVKADAVVNAANEGLSHGAGVALAIRDAAGEEFDEECQRELRLKGSLKTTQVLATRPGNLKKQFKYILNAVGPKWRQYQEKMQCLSDLHDTIVNILKEAERLCVRTLVMPAISSKIFGVPLKLCAEMYLQGIVDFSRQTALYLREIHIVDIDVSVLREMTDAYHNYKKKPDSISISGAKTRHPDLMMTLTSSSRMDIDNKKGVSASHADTAQQINNVKTPTSPESRSYEHSRTKKLSQSKGGCLFKMKDEKFGQQTAKVFTFQNKMVVKIYTGSIVRFQGDALICSNDDKMLGIGPLAKAVAASGGLKYKESFSKIGNKYLYGRHKWKLGDVETCSGGDLDVRFVVHAVIKSMFRTDQESLKSYKTTLMKIFYTINSYNNSTRFAMPLIGAGQLEDKAGDLQKCCQTFFQVLNDFFDGHQADCRIGELHLINRNPKVTQTLIDIFKCNCTQPSEYEKSPVKNEQKSRHLSFTAPSNDENTSTKFPVQRQHSWTNCTETTEKQPVEGRGLSARAKTGMSKSMYGKYPSGGATGFDRNYRYTGDSGHLTEAKSSMDNQSMRNGTEGEKTKTPAKEGNLLIISDDDDEKSHDETCDDDQRSYNETSLHDVPNVESSDDKTATCVICLDKVKDGMKLDCNHEFCKSCLTQSFTKHKKACPVCGKIFGEITGNQPQGVISFEREGRSLPGYENCGTIIVKYNFKSGIQGLEHPNPGQPYEGTERRGFLPDNAEGQKVQRLLKKAFDRRLVFTIGYSRTTGKDNVVTWNDIHHKTKRDTGAQRFGYPDPTYLQRVQEELAVKGVTE